jgi:hypothetical protein
MARDVLRKVSTRAALADVATPATATPRFTG